MAWYNSILGGGAGNTYTAIGNASATTGTTLSTSVAGSQLWANNAKTLAGMQQQQTEYYKVHTITNYAEAIGWTIEHMHLRPSMTSSDPKVAILKLATDGEIIKDTGVRLGNNFYIMREPN